MRPAGTISAAAYARRCGVTPGAISHRIRKGQITDAVHRDGARVWIDPVRADELFLQRGLPCNSKALQIENRLMDAVKEIAKELADRPAGYCRLRLTEWIDEILASC